MNCQGAQVYCNECEVCSKVIIIIMMCVLNMNYEHSEYFHLMY